MATRKPKNVNHRRKREQKTDYPKRLKLLLSGKHRVVVRFTNKKIIVQLAEFTVNGDKILLGVDSSALRKFGWEYSCKNIPSAYLIGLMFGKEALKKGHKEMIFDIGFNSPFHKGKLFAFLKGLIDAGIVVPHGGGDIFPSGERIRGKHIKEYAEKLKTDKGKNVKIFTKYFKNNLKPAEMPDVFEKVKSKINAQ